MIEEDLRQVIKNKNTQNSKNDVYLEKVKKFDILRLERGCYTKEDSKYYHINTSPNNIGSLYKEPSHRFLNPEDEWPKTSTKTITYYDKNDFNIDSDLYVEMLDKQIEREYNWLKENE